MTKTILLMGAPNVGKSAIFNRLTGLNVRVANYTGTTVDYAGGTMKLGSEMIDLIDVPGTYSLCATCEAERVAVEMVCGRTGRDCPRTSPSAGCSDSRSVATDPGQKPCLIVYVLDAGNFEAGLYLLLQLLELKVPLLIALNRGDLAREKG